MTSTLFRVRIAVWAGMALLAKTAYGRTIPSLWQIALFVAAFAYGWHAFSNRPARAIDAEVGEDSSAEEEPKLPRSQTPVVAVQMIACFAILSTSGGIRSPFLAIVFYTVVDSALLTSRGIGLWSAISAIALLGAPLIRRGGIPSLSLFAVTSAILLAVVWIAGRGGANEHGELSAEEGASDKLFGRRKAFRQMELSLQSMESEREQAISTAEQVRDTYRDVARVSRDQRAQLDRLQTELQLVNGFALSLANRATPAEALKSALSTLLDSVEARGGAVWRRNASNDLLTLAVCHGIGDSSRFGMIENASQSFPSDVRHALEAQLTPAAVRPAATAAPYPAIVALVRDPGDNSLLGAIGLCDARAATRFNDLDHERLQDISTHFAPIFLALDEQAEAERRITEVTALYDLSRLFQTATSLDQACRAAVYGAQSAMNGANTALYFFDRENQQMRLKAQRGEAPSLLEALDFGGKTGEAAWLRAGSPQVDLSDLTVADILDQTTSKTLSGSYIATPVYARKRLIGLLTHFSPTPFGLVGMAATSQRLAEQIASALERTESFSTLEQMAMTDQTTGLASSRFFSYRLEEETMRAQTFHTDGTVALIEIDKYDRIVKRKGAAHAESLLRALAERIGAVAPDHALPGRYSATQIALLLPQQSLSQSRNLLESILSQQSTETISIGAASLLVHGETPSRLRDNVENALVEALKSGGNRIETAQGFLEAVVTQVATPVKRTKTPKALPEADAKKAATTAR